MHITSIPRYHNVKKSYSFVIQELYNCVSSSYNFTLMLEANCQSNCRDISAERSICLVIKSLVIYICIFLAGSGQNPARQAAMNAGIPKEVPSTSLNMLCGSGLRAVSLCYQAILCGDADVVVAGGQESMSKVSKLHTIEWVWF